MTAHDRACEARRLRLVADAFPEGTPDWRNKRAACLRHLQAALATTMCGLVQPDPSVANDKTRCLAPYHYTEMLREACPTCEDSGAPCGDCHCEDRDEL